MKWESREIEMDIEKENSYGIGAVYLGKAVKGFSERENAADREKTVHFETFYSADGSRDAVGQKQSLRESNLL